MTQWQTQEIFCKTNQGVIINFFLPEFIRTKIAMCEWHVDDSTEIRCGVILGIYIVISLVLNLNIYENFIKGGGGPFERGTALMVSLGVY